MRQQVKNLFLKALLIGMKGFILLPVIFFVLNDTLDIYGYAQDKSSYVVRTFLIFSLVLLINFTLIIFTKIKIWKILVVIVLAIIYTLMYCYNPEIIHSRHRSVCIEGNYDDCVLKDRFEKS